MKRALFVLIATLLSAPLLAQTSTPVQAGPLTFKPQAAPTAVDGRFYYDSACKCFKWYDGTAWETFAQLDAPSGKESRR